MAIVNSQEAQVVLGLGYDGVDLTDRETDLLGIIIGHAEDAVRRHLKYDPVQATRTEFYPRHLRSGFALDPSGVWDVNSAGTHAYYKSFGGDQTLQLLRLPIRKINDLRVDHAGRHGSASGAFGSESVWTEGENYHVEWDALHYAPSGQIFAVGAWPSDPGTVKIDYVAGFAQEEFDGQAAADNDGTGNMPITSAGVSAHGIKRAVLMLLSNGMHTWNQLGKRTALGFLPGVLTSERLGDYSYTLSSALEHIAGQTMEITPEVEEMLSEFTHYGLMRL